ncbi:Hypothetical protein FKW44_015276 [Caligus rogercresseyi]|uniref:Uncharacterized protein n=1 Tax=Caligus rogercresseyi TaxID=217165 RepID=A0A7T8H038_CALRO|nr:Hypothetical protein FKW44_015276 [Caligus rogercresseyi]
MCPKVLLVKAMIYWGSIPTANGPKVPSVSTMTYWASTNHNFDLLRLQTHRP